MKNFLVFILIATTLPLVAHVDLVVSEQVTVQTRAETPTPKTIKVTYMVKSTLPSVNVRAMAWKDGIRNFSNIIPVRTGEGVPRGESVTTNEVHTFVWDVSSDWATDLDKVAVEILVQAGTLLPQELVTIPATKTHKAMTITTNELRSEDVYNAFFWCYAEGDSRINNENGIVTIDGVRVAYTNGYFLVWADEFILSDLDWAGTANGMNTLLNYLYNKMGYKLLDNENLNYARRATRLDFPNGPLVFESEDFRPNGYSMRSVKIEEGE